MDEVIVTGSRIASPNATSTSPVQVVTREEMQVSGKHDVTDLIAQLPQNFTNDLGQDLGNRTPGLTTAGGVATANLRGLGPNRTLVLVDGRRLGIGSPYTFIQAPAPDLDQIPTALVERVEVVTGGASATYGSDAIGGVVNFIMKKNFEGFQVDASFGGNWHDNHNSYVQDAIRDVGGTPLTGTSTDGQTISVGTETYIVPLVTVVESLQPQAQDIRTIAGQARMLRVRDDYLPLIDLAAFYMLSDGRLSDGRLSDGMPSHGIHRSANPAMAVIVEADGQRLALEVDELLGQQQVVVKNLETNYRRVPGVSGATILGDGRVALIVDPDGVAHAQLLAAAA